MMKWIIQSIDRVGQWFRAKLDTYECDDQKFVVQEVTSVPSREKNVHGKELAVQLRHSGVLYYMASVAWLAKNSTKDFSDFDNLSLKTKETWMSQVQNA